LGECFERIESKNANSKNYTLEKIWNQVIFLWNIDVYKLQVIVDEMHNNFKTLHHINNFIPSIWISSWSMDFHEEKWMTIISLNNGMALRFKII
jgi:hypothetical protein